MISIPRKLELVDEKLEQIYGIKDEIFNYGSSDDIENWIDAVAYYKNMRNELLNWRY